MLTKQNKEHHLKQMRNQRREMIISLYQYDFYQNQSPKEQNCQQIPSNMLWFTKIIDNLTIIDNIIKKNLYNYQLNRLNKVDKAIVRLATAEFLERKINYKIIMNEMIEFTKEYSSLNDHKQYKFTNKLLQLIYENIVQNKYQI